MGWKMGLMDYAGGAYPAVQAYLAAQNNKQKQQESAARMALEQRRMALEEQRLQALMNAQKEEQMLKAGMRNAILGAVEPSRDYASGLMALEQQNPAMVETRQEEVRGMEEPYSYRAATEAGTPALRGLMQGGLNPQKALSAAMPYMEPAQMITAIQNMQNMPLELQNKILNMDVMRSTIKKNESQADKNRRPEEPKKFDWDALITGGKYTPESIEDAKLAGDPRKLKFVEKPDTNKPNILELTKQSLRDKLGRDPTAAEILKAKEDSDIRITSNKAVASEKSKLDMQRGLITDADVENYARYVATAGEYPAEFNRLFRLPALQQETIRRVTEKLTEWGISGSDRALESANYKANRSSLMFQEKQRGAAKSFVQNINGQLDKIGKIMQDTISRVGTRAIDLPIRELKTRFAGSGHERVLESYLMEVSREIGKLSTGSQASIAELSVDAQKKWDRIHDPNLSFRDLKEILAATRDQANIRLKSIEDAITDTKKRFGMGMQSGEDTTQPSNADPLGIR